MKTFNHIFTSAHWCDSYCLNRALRPLMYSVSLMSSKFIYGSFCWDETMQGFDYWRTIHRFWYKLHYHTLTIEDPLYNMT